MPSPYRERDRFSSDEIWRAKFDIAVERFKAGQIGEPTFRLDLKNLGFNDTEISAEVALHRP